MVRLLPLYLAALAVAADLASECIGAPGEWLVVPLLLDFQPVLLPIDTSRHLRGQLEWFCRVHGLDAERCAGASASGIAEVVDVDSRCRHPQATDELPGFLMLRNAFPVSTTSNHDKPVIKWRQDGAGNIARDLCRFARDHGDTEELTDSTLGECAASLTATLSASFDWMLSLEPCDQRTPLQEIDTNSVQAPSIELKFHDRESDGQDRADAMPESEQRHDRRERHLSDRKHTHLDDDAENEASGCDKDTCSIEIKSIDLLQPEAPTTVHVAESSKIEHTPKQRLSGIGVEPRGRARGLQPKSFFEELRSLPMKTTSHYSWDAEPPQWIVAVTLLMLLAIVYLAFDVALLCLHKLKQSIGSQKALHCIGSMGWPLVHDDERSVLKSDDGSSDCGDNIENRNSSMADAAISSESELRSPEGVQLVDESTSIAPDAANPSRTSLPALQYASSSIRRARSWSSPCLNLGLHFQSNFQSNSNQLTPRPSRNTVRISLYRALSCNEDSDDSVSCHPSFARAAMAVMMTRPCSVLQGKPVAAAPVRPTPLLSSLVETEAITHRPHHLVAALRIQRIWRSRSGVASDDSSADIGADGNNQHRLPTSCHILSQTELLTAMESIAETVDGDCVASSAETTRLRSHFARFLPSRPKY